MNDMIILLCAVILLLTVLPMFLLGSAFKGAKKRQNASGDSAHAVAAEGSPSKVGRDAGVGDPGGDGGGGGE